MSDDVDADHLVSVAVKEGLAGFLYRSLAGSDLLESLGHNQREALQSLYYQAVAQNTKLIHDLKQVLQVLNQENTRVVLLQGIALLQEVYDDIGLRPLTDIDLWVLQADYPGLANILTSQGFERDPVYPNCFKKGSTTLDIHTHILWADRIKARAYLLAKGQGHIYQETRKIDVEGQHALCLSRYDQVLYLSLHALKHDVERLIWLADIKSLLADWKTSDWEALKDRARELGQEKTLSYILYLLQEVFDYELPSEARRILERNRLRFLEARILRQRAYKDSLPVWASLVLFSSGKAFHKRFLFVLETLFPRPEILRQTVPDSGDFKVWQLYVKRVGHLLGMMRKLRG